MPTTADLETYFVECRARDGILYVPEFWLGQSRAQVVKGIQSGQVWRPNAVIYLNPVEGVCRDVTEDVMHDVAALARDEGYLHAEALEWIERVDPELANAIRWAA